jgi:hypothetical protein
MYQQIIDRRICGEHKTQPGQSLEKVQSVSFRRVRVQRFAIELAQSGSRHSDGDMRLINITKFRMTRRWSHAAMNALAWVDLVQKVLERVQHAKQQLLVLLGLVSARFSLVAFERIQAFAAAIKYVQLVEDHGSFDQWISNAAN